MNDRKKVYYFKKKANNFIKLKWYEYIISSIALLFAANQEQGFAILLGTYFFYIIYCFINKRKISFFVILNIVLIIASGTIYLYMSWKLGVERNKKLKIGSQILEHYPFLEKLK